VVVTVLGIWALTSRAISTKVTSVLPWFGRNGLPIIAFPLLLFAGDWMMGELQAVLRRYRYPSSVVEAKHPSSEDDDSSPEVLCRL
jgi:hypothetical protein